MPITIKSTELKYKNPSTGQYQGIDAVAETTTSQQCALIEAKGAETIASIPSDYTTLSDTVDDLNGAITSLGSDDIANDSTNVSGLKVTNALDTLNGAITSLGSDDIANDSTNVSGLKVTNALDTLNGAITSKLFIKSGTISAAHTSSTTTTLATDTSLVNANTDIANVWFSNPEYITSNYTIATNASGQVQITCTNSAAVTVYVVLFNP